ncbi:hypothetical protein AN191_11730 [Loktanella sp. 5RATIMAR09]|nr:hypothetical protein AN191_11730 [Loktanella sp. 5RATIMAR09]
MKIDRSFAVKLLMLIEDEDSGQGVDFSDHDYVSSHNYANDQKAVFLSNHDLSSRTKAHLDFLAEEGKITERSGRPECTTYSVSSFGHRALQEHRDNIWYKRTWKALVRWMDKAMTSILLPIVVSILTVYLLKYLDLD